MALDGGGARLAGEVGMLCEWGNLWGWDTIIPIEGEWRVKRKFEWWENEGKGRKGLTSVEYGSCDWTWMTCGEMGTMRESIPLWRWGFEWGIVGRLGGSYPAVDVRERKSWEVFGEKKKKNWRGRALTETTTSGVQGLGCRGPGPGLWAWILQIHTKCLYQGKHIRCSALLR